MEKFLVINDLHACIYLPETSPTEVVVGIHGFSGDKESSVLIELSKHLNKNGVALVTFDLPCHGENDYTKILNLDECINSIKTIFNFTKEHFKHTPISIFATSFGGYLLLNYLSKNEETLNKVILRAPAVFMAEVLTNSFLKWRNLSKEDLATPVSVGKKQNLFIDGTFLNDLQLNNLENAKPTNHYLYIIQGKRDDIVDPVKNEGFFKKHYPNKHKFIWFENADHQFKKPGELERIISETMKILN